MPNTSTEEEPPSTIESGSNTSVKNPQQERINFDDSDDSDDDVDAAHSETELKSQRSKEVEKTLTFRRRRLTCSSQNMQSIADQLSQVVDGDDDDDDDAELDGTSGAQDSAASEKRKLLLRSDNNDSKRMKLDDNEEDRDTMEGTEANEDGILIAVETLDGSLKSLKTIMTAVPIISRVLHASAPPVPKCPRRQSHLLYLHPPNVNDLLSTQNSASVLRRGGYFVDRRQMAPVEEGNDGQPEWKKVHQIRHGSESEKEDDDQLPFPRNVVGTYSCHGIEPVYESDEWHFTNDSENTLTATAKINQDRGGIAFPYANCPKTAVFAAYDGHGEGGEFVAQFALHEIPNRLEQHEDFKKGNIEQAFKDVFISVNADLELEQDIEPLYSGCTACVALVRGNEIHFANAGDSRAVMACAIVENGGVEYRALDLTLDQNPDSPGEKERIEAAGGFVSPPPEVGLSARVWLDPGFSQIGLAMGRSLGDYAVKTVGVIAEPVVSRHELQPNDEFMIIATDGVWEFLSSQDAVDIVAKGLQNGDGSSMACQHLIEAAAAKWHEREGDYRDDITALVIQMKELWAKH